MPKIPSALAGYMELVGAVKDGDCKIVAVADGISKQRGCCNKFQPENAKTVQFSCGNCEYVTDKKFKALEKALRK